MGRGSMIGLVVAAMLLSTAMADRKTLAAAAAPAPAAPEYFITIEGGEFMNGCQSFYPAGWNQWEVVEAAAGAPYLLGASLPDGMTGPALVRNLLEVASNNSLNTMRTWAFTVDEQFAMQTAPGVYNEAVFRGLDYLLDEARKAGIKLILAFTTNWTPVGGLPQYLTWANESNVEAFFTSPAISKMYQDHVHTVLTRVNTINGRTYSEDPTIFAWNLINEPRCTGCANGTISSWVKEQAAYVKSLDTNHLLTVGEDGFFTFGSTANPGVEWTEWAAQEGQDFIADHSSPDIDFATFHTWVDNWQEVSVDWQTQWIAAHETAARETLKKPVIQEEFGKWYNLTAPDSTLADRDSFMKAAYEQTTAAQAKGAESALKGSMFWQFYAQGQEAPLTEDGGRGLYGIFESDTSFDYVRANAESVNKLAVAAAEGCQVAAADVTTPPSCEATWVRGLAGTGMEGPDCNIPINECVRGTDDCGVNAACIDTDAGFTCQCYWGYTGDGLTCTASAAAMTLLQSAYYTEPERAACDPGTDVAYPVDAPGYSYDILGAYTSDFGSRVNVSLAECEIACQMAETCESITYNSVQRSCFLKRSQCPIYNYCYDPQEVLCNSTESRAGQTIEYSIPCGYWMTYYRLDMDTTAACEAFQPQGPTTGANASVVAVFDDFLDSAAATKLAHYEAAPAVEPAAETTGSIALTSPTVQAAAGGAQ